MRVLVADDSIVSRHMLQSTLKSWGYTVTLAADGVQAWDELKRPNAPRLAILDWMMPGLTGPEVCRRIRAHAANAYTYVLLLTSRNLKEDLIEGMEAGADDYITKPFDHHELRVRLRAGTRILDLQTELLAAREALREQATKDGLTRLWNRASILDMLRAEISRAAREHSTLSIGLVDLDRFKLVNDTYGHLAGDAVLEQAAQRLQHGIRSYDLLGRYGGEEFLIILPGCGEPEALAQAERMRTELSRAPMVFGSGTVPVTGSFGMTTAAPFRACTPEELIHVADEALYAAKAAGRDRVVFRPIELSCLV